MICGAVVSTCLYVQGKREQGTLLPVLHTVHLFNSLLSDSLTHRRHTNKTTVLDVLSDLKCTWN